MWDERYNFRVEGWDWSQVRWDWNKHRKIRQFRKLKFPSGHIQGGTPSSQVGVPPSNWQAGELDLHTSGNELRFDLCKSDNELILDLHKSGNELNLHLHESGQELSLAIHNSCNELRLDL